MAKRKFNWAKLSFEALPVATNYSAPDILDGEIITTVDQRIRQLFAGQVTASVTDALSIPAILRGRNIICNISTLPLITTKSDNKVVLNYFLRDINPDVPNGKVISDTVQDLLFYGKAYWYVDVFDSKGYPLSASFVEYNRVTLNNDGDEYWLDGKRIEYRRIIDFHSTNPALLETVAGSIERAKSLFAASAMYARNPIPKLVVTPKADVDPDPAQVEEAMQNLADSAADSPYVYSGAAVDLKALDLLSPADLQLIEGLKMVAIDFANALGIDPEDLGVSTTSRTYQNAVDRRKDRVNDVLNVYMQAVSTRLSKGDVTPGGYSVRFDQDDYLRADPKTRMEVYTGYLAAGVMTVDEVRAKEGLPAMTQQQRALQPAKPSNQFAADPGETFSIDAGAEFTAFDEETRTVEVLAVPFNKPSRLHNGRFMVFLPGSISYPDEIKRVKLLRDHVNTFSGGYATSIKETPEGLVATFKIAKGHEGDTILAGFIEGNYDHASVGVEPINPADTYSDKRYPGHTFVRKARLREVSQVAIPAFEDARLISVKASGEEIDMTDNLDGANNEVPVSFSNEQFKSLLDALKPQTPESVQTDPNVVPREYKSNDQEKRVEVKEELPYRFDGSAGAYEFSADLISLAKHDDPNTRARLNDFLAADFAVSTSNASGLNPTAQRPDLWVGQMDIRTPIMDAIYKGSPPNGVTPFSFPKYNASSTLVADHTEGTEPTLGAYSVTNQTVTPTALSGKIEVNREAWDQGGSPALSQLIRTEMHRAYNEGLETSAATFLDGLTLTGKEITIAAGSADSVLEGLVIDALVALQGDRGGQYLTDFLAHVDLYKALAKAKDSAGRRLFPAYGPSNATGTVSSKFTSLDVNGFLVRMAPALGATGVVAENSYLLDPAKVHAWATPPQDLTFDIQVKSIYLGIWGYKAFALRDVNGIRRFIYDPVA